MSESRKLIHLPQVRMLSRGARQAGGIRITSVKTIKPPDPEALKKLEEEKLRAKLQKEIVSRARTCANKSYECHLPVVSNRLYCARHILQDPSAPYKQCSYTCGSVRCQGPAPVDKETALCFEHARMAMHSRHRSTAPPPPVETTETFLNQLQHYVRPERTRTTSCASSVSVVSDPADQELATPNAVDPFKQIDATSVNAAYSASIIECASASESDEDSVTLGPDGDCRAGAELDLEDPEIAPTEEEPLWHAGVFTVEEAVNEAKNTLVNLQSAYKRQMWRLKTLLQTERLKYLRALKTEKEQYCSINSQARTGPTTVRERRQLRKLKAYASYRRRHGNDAVLYKKLLKKRAKVNELPSNRPIPSLGRCTFTEYNVRCGNHSLPAARHCLKHVLHDKHQVLFTPCGDTRGGVPCREPISRLPLPSSSCRYHTNPPLYTVFTLKKDESDSDSDSQTTSTMTEVGEHEERPEITDGQTQELTLYESLN